MQTNINTRLLVCGSNIGVDMYKLCSSSRGLFYSFFCKNYKMYLFNVYVNVQGL